MLHFTIRRLLFAIPTLLVISFIIFALLDLSPGDPTANLPLTIPAEVREQIRHQPRPRRAVPHPLPEVARSSSSSTSR